MPGWYGHTVSVEVDDKYNFPKYSGKYSFLNDILSEENERIHNKFKNLGESIANDIALDSQMVQRNTITELEAVDTGRLRDSVKVTGYGLTRQIGTDLFYAKTVHDIGYKNQKIFNINGIVVRGHSDIGPRPWSEIAAGEVADHIDGIVRSKVDEVF